MVAEERPHEKLPADDMGFQKKERLFFCDRRGVYKKRKPVFIIWTQALAACPPLVF